ncbi:MAG: hypothetical protein QW727_00040 [Candidatus Pacearchaeota archaeon]
MLNKNEILSIIVVVIVLVFVVNLKMSINGKINYGFIFISSMFILLIILTNIITKKFAAEYFESKLDVKIWDLKRYGFRREKYFKKPLPAGIIVPFLTSIISAGNFLWFACFESNIESTSARASKRHEIYKFTEMTDLHMSLIISSGVIANLILAIIAYLINIPELAKWNIYFAAYSLIPLGNLDGTKIFFGKIQIWFALVIITGIFLLYALFLPM